MEYGQQSTIKIWRQKVIIIIARTCIKKMGGLTYQLKLFSIFILRVDAIILLINYWVSAYILLFRKLIKIEMWDQGTI